SWDSSRDFLDRTIKDFSLQRTSLPTLLAHSTASQTIDRSDISVALHRPDAECNRFWRTFRTAHQ
ncbi:MAG: hypothetical protein ACRD28_14830, partial [Acidobacteriaceae bacterium]